VPEADARVVAQARVEAGGGPAANAAVALARLGVDACFVGAVGDDDAGDRIRAGLEREGVDLRALQTVPGAMSPSSTILVGPDGRRAIVHWPGTLPALELDEDAMALCREADWVHADHVGYAAVRRLDVRLSVDGGNPIDGLDLRGVALYAPTEAELRRVFVSAADAIAAGAELVVATRGAHGCTAAGRDGTTIEAAGYPVEVVSTLGAGDVFHGALLAGLSRGVPLDEALADANACAALSCRALDGRSAIPTADELRRRYV
jgi:sulfofructose kinase